MLTNAATEEDPQEIRPKVVIKRREVAAAMSDDVSYMRAVYVSNCDSPRSDSWGSPSASGFPNFIRRCIRIGRIGTANWQVQL